MYTDEAVDAVKNKRLLIRMAGPKSYYIFPIKIINNMIICGYCHKDKNIALECINENYHEHTYVGDCELATNIEGELSNDALLNLQLKKMGYD